MITDPTAELERFQRRVNMDRAHDQALKIRERDAMIRKLVYHLEQGIPVASVDLEQAKRLSE